MRSLNVTVLFLIGFSVLAGCSSETANTVLPPSGKTVEDFQDRIKAEEEAERAKEERNRTGG